MSLDEKWIDAGGSPTGRAYPEENVKQFIEEILESPLKEVWQIKALIKNRAGEGLI